jgi:hypothetical protein
MSKSQITLRAAQVLMLSIALTGLATVDVLAVTTAQQVGACHRSKTCKVSSPGKIGDVVVFTGSGHVIWCPPEKDGKCVPVR